MSNAPGALEAELRDLAERVIAARNTPDFDQVIDYAVDRLLPQNVPDNKRKRYRARLLQIVTDNSNSGPDFLTHALDTLGRTTLDIRSAIQRLFLSEELWTPNACSIPTKDQSRAAGRPPPGTNPNAPPAQNNAAPPAVTETADPDTLEVSTRIENAVDAHIAGDQGIRDTALQEAAQYLPLTGQQNANARRAAFPGRAVTALNRLGQAGNIDRLVAIRTIKAMYHSVSAPPFDVVALGIAETIWDANEPRIQTCLAYITQVGLFNGHISPAANDAVQFLGDCLPMGALTAGQQQDARRQEFVQRAEAILTANAGNQGAALQALTRLYHDMTHDPEFVRPVGQAPVETADENAAHIQRFIGQIIHLHFTLPRNTTGLTTVIDHMTECLPGVATLPPGEHDRRRHELSDAVHQILTADPVTRGPRTIAQFTEIRAEIGVAYRAAATNGLVQTRNPDRRDLHGQFHILFTNIGTALNQAPNLDAMNYVLARLPWGNLPAPERDRRIQEFRDAIADVLSIPNLQEFQAIAGLNQVYIEILAGLVETPRPQRPDIRTHVTSLIQEHIAGHTAQRDDALHYVRDRLPVGGFPAPQQILLRDEFSAQVMARLRECTVANQPTIDAATVAIDGYYASIARREPLTTSNPEFRTDIQGQIDAILNPALNPQGLPLNPFAVTAAINYMRDRIETQLTGQHRTRMREEFSQAVAQILQTRDGDNDINRARLIRAMREASGARGEITTDNPNRPDIQTMLGHIYMHHRSLSHLERDDEITFVVNRLDVHRLPPADAQPRRTALRDTILAILGRNLARDATITAINAAFHEQSIPAVITTHAHAIEPRIHAVAEAHEHHNAAGIDAAVTRMIESLPPLVLPTGLPTEQQAKMTAELLAKQTAERERTLLAQVQSILRTAQTMTLDQARDAVLLEIRGVLDAFPLPPRRNPTAAQTRADRQERMGRIAVPLIRAMRTMLGTSTGATESAIGRLVQAQLQLAVNQPQSNDQIITNITAAVTDLLSRSGIRFGADVEGEIAAAYEAAAHAHIHPEHKHYHPHAHPAPQKGYVEPTSQASRDAGLGASDAAIQRMFGSPSTKDDKNKKEDGH